MQSVQFVNGTRGDMGGARGLKALDLFCGAGGASMGLSRAGFDVAGVDINPQKNYPFGFIQADALTVPLEGYDFYWASPPCQAFTLAGLSHRMNGKEYPDLVAAIRERLNETGKPYVIENVPGAPIRPDVILCGSLFGMRLVRHRWFELSGFPFTLTQSCAHHPDPVTVCGHGTPNWVRERRGGVAFKQQEKRDAMGIDWMNRGELAQAIPPAYSEWIAKRILASV